MTQGKWNLISRGLWLLVGDLYLAEVLFSEEIGNRILFPLLGLVIGIIVTAADFAVKRKLKREGRYSDRKDAPMDWDKKGVIVRAIGGLVILLLFVAAIGGSAEGQVIPIREDMPVFMGMDSLLIKIAALVAFPVYFMYIEYENYSRNYASERKTNEDGDRTRRWEE